MIPITRPDCPWPQALVAGDYKHPKNKLALMQASHGKCMYCESTIRHIDYGDVEHIKPKAPDKFPELEFVWENLGFSCGICNNNKGESFDTATPYLNPYGEDPQDHITFLGWILIPMRGSERGALTIHDLKLNRPELIEARRRRIGTFLKAVEACFRTTNPRLRIAAIEALKADSQPDMEYSLAIKVATSGQGIV